MAADDVAHRIAHLSAKGFHKTCGMNVVSAADGKARVELQVAPSLHNVNGMLHGGVIATLVDHAGTLAILSADRQGRAGVTTDLNVTYLAPGTGDALIYADATVLRIGKTMAFVTVDVRRRPDDVLIAQGRMTKFQG